MPVEFHVWWGFEVRYREAETRYRMSQTDASRLLAALVNSALVTTDNQWLKSALESMFGTPAVADAFPFWHKYVHLIVKQT